ncbi:hypothetical protein Tco_1408224 [Tanacetum coccineum]
MNDNNNDGKNQITKNTRESDSVRKVNDVNSGKGLENDGKKGFEGDLNGIQFPPINEVNKEKNLNSEENKECLDEGCNSVNSFKTVECTEKVNTGEEEVVKQSGNGDKTWGSGSGGVSLADLIKGVVDFVLFYGVSFKQYIGAIVNDVNNGKGLKNDGKKGFEGDLNESEYWRRGSGKQSGNGDKTWGSGSGGVSLADLIKGSKLDNKLMQIPTAVSIGRIGFARVLVEIEAGKGIKDKIEVMKKQDNEVKDKRAGVNDNSDGKMEDKGKKGNNEENEKVNDKIHQEGSTSMDNIRDGILGSNRFTLIDSLINEDDLVPNTNQRKIVDEFLNKEIIGKSGDRNKWIEEMKRYYRDRKEMFDANKDLEECEDVLDTNGDENYNVMRNEMEGPGGSLN